MIQNSNNVIDFYWPEISGTVSIVAIALALAIFVFGMLSGARANKFRIIFAVCLATAIGWCAMPLIVKAAAACNILETKAGIVAIITALMLFVSALATSIYEIITVTLPDIGLSSKR